MEYKRSREDTAYLVDSILRVLVGGGVISAALIMPGLAVAVDKPLEWFFNRLDKRQRERELKQVLYYMKSYELIESHDYEHGVTITEKGMKRLEATNIKQLEITPPKHWDGNWRLVFFDIPEKYKAGRNALASKLRELKFQPLQKSVWIHPYPCHDEIAAVTAHFGINRYVTYVETSHIDNQEALIKRFAKNYDLK